MTDTPAPVSVEDNFKKLLSSAIAITDKLDDNQKAVTFNFMTAEECDAALQCIKHLYPGMQPESFSDAVDEYFELQEGDEAPTPNSFRITYNDGGNNDVIASLLVEKYKDALFGFFEMNTPFARDEAIPEDFLDADGSLSDPQKIALYSMWLRSEKGQKTCPYNYELNEVYNKVLKAKIQLRQQRGLITSEDEIIEGYEGTSHAAPTTIEEPLSNSIPALRELENKMLELAIDLEFVCPPAIGYVYLMMKDEKVAAYLKTHNIEAGFLAKSTYEALTAAIFHDYDEFYTYQPASMDTPMLTEEDDVELPDLTPGAITESIEYNDPETLYGHIQSLFAGAAAIGNQLELVDAFKALMEPGKENYLKHIMHDEFKIPEDRFKDLEKPKPQIKRWSLEEHRRGGRDKGRDDGEERRR